MNFILIAPTSFELARHSAELNLRSAEKRLESLQRDFDTSEYSNTIKVRVHDKADAILLARALDLNNISYCENGISSKLKIKALMKSRSSAIVVSVPGMAESMTFARFKKYSLKELKKSHLTKTQIIKSQLLTKSQLENGIADGLLKPYNFGNKIFISRVDLLAVI